MEVRQLAVAFPPLPSEHGRPQSQQQLGLPSRQQARSEATVAGDTSTRWPLEAAEATKKM